MHSSSCEIWAPQLPWRRLLAGEPSKALDDGCRYVVTLLMRSPKTGMVPTVGDVQYWSVELLKPGLTGAYAYLVKQQNMGPARMSDWSSFLKSPVWPRNPAKHLSDSALSSPAASSFSLLVWAVWHAEIEHLLFWLKDLQQSYDFPWGPAPIPGYLPYETSWGGSPLHLKAPSAWTPPPSCKPKGSSDLPGMQFRLKIST